MLLVVNFDVPLQPDSYLRRISKRGAFSRNGIVVNFASTSEQPLLDEVERVHGMVRSGGIYASSSHPVDKLQTMGSIDSRTQV